MNIQLHGNLVAPEEARRFKDMINWLRSAEHGPQLSWGQMAGDRRIRAVLDEGGNPAQVLQDVHRSRAPARALYEAVERMHDEHRELARNGVYGSLGREDEPTPKKRKRQRRGVPDAEYRERLRQLVGGQAKAFTTTDLIISARGDRTALRRALHHLVEAGEVEVVEGPWPPERGRQTLLSQKGGPGTAPEAAEAEAPDEDAGAPTLARARHHLQATIETLEALAAADMPNVPRGVREFVKGEYAGYVKAARSLLEQLAE